MQALLLDRAVDATPSSKASLLALGPAFSFRPLDGFSIVESIFFFVHFLFLFVFSLVLFPITFPCPFLALFVKPAGVSKGTPAAPKIPPPTWPMAASRCVCCRRGQQKLLSRRAGGCALEPAV